MGADEHCGEPGRCAQALAELEAYLDGELPAERLDGIRTHLTACYPCTDRVTFEEQLRAVVRRDCVDHAPASLRTRIASLLEVDTPPGSHGH